MPNFKLRLEPDVTVTQADQRVILFSKRTGSFFGLNAFAAHAVEKLQQTDLESFVREVTAQFAVDAATVQQDMQTLVDQLVDKRLAQPEFVQS